MSDEAGRAIMRRLAVDNYRLDIEKVLEEADARGEKALAVEALKSFLEDLPE